MYKILLVDDEDLERQALKIILEEIKDNVIIIGEAENGMKAIELDEEFNPDIIFMDIKMPGVDGIKASEIIKSKDENKIIIMLTAYDDFDLIHKALTLGVNDYILKPVRPKELLKVLETQIVNLKVNKNKIKELELLLIDNIVLGEKIEAKKILKNIVESYSILSNGNTNYFKEKSYLLGEKVIKISSKLRLKNNKWIDTEEFSSKIKLLDAIQSISLYINDLIDSLLREIIQQDDIEKDNDLNKTLEPALRYIHENYEEEITLEKVAKISNVSTYYFSKLFKKETGMNFITYVTKCKLERAKELLKSTSEPIINIAASLGYYECSYFTRVFKKMEGITPTKYRNMHNRKGLNK